MTTTRGVAPAWAQGAEAGAGCAASAELERLGEAMYERYDAGDFSGAAALAEQLRNLAPNDPLVRLHAANVWLKNGQSQEALLDADRALRLDDSIAASWAMRGVAKNNVGRISEAIADLDRALDLEPDAAVYQAMRAYAGARQDTGWQADFRRLVRLQAQHPDHPEMRDNLVRIYLDRSVDGWTVVEDDARGGTIIRGARKVLRLALGGEIPPGRYPTRAEQVKSAALCLERARALSSQDAELTAGVQELSEVLESAQGRRFSATWGEIGVSVIGLLAGLFYLPSAFGVGLLMLAASTAMLMSAWVPQYRLNRIALSRRGETLGNAAIAVAQRHRYGGMIYLGSLLFFFPFVAAYKLYMNWCEGWLAKSPLAELLAPDTPPSSRQDVDRGAPNEEPSGSDEPMPAHLSATDETPCIRQAQVVPLHAAPPAAAATPAPVQAEPPAPQLSVSPAAHATEAAEGHARTRTPSTAPVLARLRRGVADFSPRARIGLLAGSAMVIVVAAASWWGTHRPGAPPATTSGPAVSVPTVAAPTPPPAEAVEGPKGGIAIANAVSGRPRVIDTGALDFGGQVVRLNGIAGESGIPARQMASFISEQGGTLSCGRLRNGFYKCRTGSGYDIAAAALVNGAARLRPDAPPEYKQLEASAQAERRGIWQ